MHSIIRSFALAACGGIICGLVVLFGFKINLAEEASAQGALLPAPSYDSNWVNVPTTGVCVVVNHKLGGDVNRYVVDVVFKQPGNPYWGINHHRYGGAYTYNPTKSGFQEMGTYWRDLNTTSITLCNYTPTALSQRVRIWKY